MITAVTYFLVSAAPSGHHMWHVMMVSRQRNAPPATNHILPNWCISLSSLMHHCSFEIQLSHWNEFLKNFQIAVFKTDDSDGWFCTNITILTLVWAPVTGVVTPALTLTDWRQGSPEPEEDRGLREEKAVTHIMKRDKNKTPPLLKWHHLVSALCLH